MTKHTTGCFVVIKRVRLMSCWSQEEVLNLLSQVEERPFSKLPNRLRLEMKLRKFSFGPRQPTRSEQLEAELDAIDHRKYTHTETLDDLINFYKRKPSHAE